LIDALNTMPLPCRRRHFPALMPLLTLMMIRHYMMPPCRYDALAAAMII